MKEDSKSSPLWDYLPSVTLDRHSPHFSYDKSPKGGNLDEPRGIEVESGRMANETPIGQFWRWIKAWRRGLVAKEWFSSIEYLHQFVISSQNKTID
jgi:hypothetical protein